MYSKDVSQLIIDSVGERGRATPRKDLVVLNCLEGLDDGKVKWKLAKKRVEKMKREGDWEMAVFRSDACVIGKSLSSAQSGLMDRYLFAVSREVASSQWRKITP